MTEDIQELAPAPEPAAQPEPAPREPSGNLSETLDNAFDRVFEDQPEMQSGRARDPSTGRFAPKAEDAPAKAVAPETDLKAEPAKPEAKDEAPKPFNPDEPPSRLSPEAKAAWKAAPVEVRADIHRAFTEMEQGIVKYRQDATRWQNDVQPYENLAKQYGMDIKGVLADYEGMSRMMATNPVQVFDTLAKRHGFTLPDLAAHVLNMDLDDAIQPVLSENKTLQQENMQLKQQLQEYTGRQQTEIQSFVAEFAVKNPRYEELEPTIAGVLRSGMVAASDPRQRLQEAYEIADRLKPAARQPAPQNPGLAVQTRKGQLSVTGAPGSGSDPVNRKPPASARSAVDGAFDKLGL